MYLKYFLISIVILFSGCASNQTLTQVTPFETKKIWKNNHSDNFFIKCNIDNNKDYVSIKCDNKNITDIDLKYVRFDLMENLKEIDLSHNNITDIPFTLSQNISIEKIDLSYNKINYPFFSLERMSSLKYLDYSNNNTRILSENIVIGSHNQLKINVYNNPLKKVSTELSGYLIYEKN